MASRFFSVWKWPIIITLIVVCIIVIVVLAVLGVFGQGKTSAQVLGPDAPTNQRVLIAARNDNSRYQVILTTSSGTASAPVWNQMYYIMFNPATSTDPTQTTFATYDEAYSYYKSDYVATPLNKSYSPLSSTAANADYTKLRLV